MTPLVSLIIPIRADREAASRLLGRISVDLRVEILVVEAGREPGLESLGEGRPDIKLIHSSPGRARQMNAAAGLARGEWLLFLHADSRLPEDWLEAFASAAEGPVGGGWFRFALDDAAWQARLIERGVALRVRLFALPYGDQGLFVRRRTFAEMGGYRDIPLMEDVDFIRRLKARAAVAEVPRTIVTSARRWRRDGWFQRSARNLTLLSLYLCGVSPARLARWY
jgi:rSAM/selenodomain-associated transferase 2